MVKKMLGNLRPGLKKAREDEIERLIDAIGVVPHENSLPTIGAHLVTGKGSIDLFRVDRDKDYLLPGEASEMAEHMVNFLTWQSYDEADVETLIQRFVAYVNYCHLHDLKMSNEMCYMALGVHRKTMMHWEYGFYGTAEHQHFAKKVLQFLSANRELQMVQGNLNPVVGIWWQKNYDGLRDQSELVVTTRDPLQGYKSTDELEKKYLESVGIIDYPKIPPQIAPKNDSDDEG